VCASIAGSGNQIKNSGLMSASIRTATGRRGPSHRLWLAKRHQQEDDLGRPAAAIPH